MTELLLMAFWIVLAAGCFWFFWWIDRRNYRRANRNLFVTSGKTIEEAIDNGPFLVGDMSGDMQVRTILIESVGKNLWSIEYVFGYPPKYKMNSNMEVVEQ